MIHAKNNFSSKKDLIFYILLQRMPYRLLIIFLALTASITGLLIPILQKEFVATLSLQQLFFATVLTFISFTCFQLTNFFGQKEALIMQGSLAQVLYSHIIKLKALSALKTVGEKVALYTTDVPSSTMWLEQSLPYFLTTVFPLALAPYFLKNYYGLPYMSTLSILCVLVIFNMLMAYRQSIFFFRFKILAGERMGLVNEWLQNIKSLKILNWISSFEEKIIKKRKEETHNRILMVTNGQIMNSFSASITFWLNLFVLIFLYFSMSETIHRSDLLMLLWVIGIFLSRPLRQLPWLLTMFFDALTSVSRLFDYLKLQNRPSQITTTNAVIRNSVLEIQNLNLNISSQSILKNINLTILKNETVALIGPVGSGKSLLLKTILNEVEFTATKMYSSQLSYLPQEPFILSATIKDNISLAYDSAESDEACSKALELAEFDILQDRLPEGLNTTLGERGLNLSGGQKQRLNLSRIFFEPKDLILLDDPFSAVDIGTEEKLIQNMTSLKNSGHAFLVTTQRYSFLDYCDRVLFLDAGQIEFNGTVSEFIKIKKYQEFLK